MKIEQIIYQTTRNVLNLEDKLSIATIFLFCEKIGTKKIAELLYTENPKQFIEEVNYLYEDYQVDFSVHLSNENIQKAFELTREKYIEKNDDKGFYKAVYEQDPFALVICDIMNRSQSYDIAVMLSNVKESQKQLKLDL